MSSCPLLMKLMLVRIPEAETALYNKSNVRVHDTTENNISSIIFYFNHSMLYLINKVFLFLSQHYLSKSCRLFQQLVIFMSLLKE